MVRLLRIVQTSATYEHEKRFRINAPRAVACVCRSRSEFVSRASSRMAELASNPRTFQ
jgi:hypothetical protein